MRNTVDMLHPRTHAAFPPPSKISLADKAVVPQVAESGRDREAYVRATADDIAQRYLDERNKYAAKTPSSIWGHARVTSRDVQVSAAMMPDARALSRVPRHVKSAFDAFDANHSGYLDYRELRYALGYLGIDVGSDRAAATVLYAYDDHPDGKLDLIEFGRLCEDVEERGGVFARPEALGPVDVVPPRVRAAFDLFDADGSGSIDAPELRRALRHYGIDLTEYETAHVLEEYDDHPDGKLDLPEFAQLVRDASRGFVLTTRTSKAHLASSHSRSASSDGASAAATLAAAGAERVKYVSNGGRFGAAGGEWPHHEGEEARLGRLRDELARDDAKVLRQQGFWGDPNGEWVRGQLLREAQGRAAAEAEAAVAKAEAAAAIARVEALSAAAAARALEIDAAAKRVHHNEMVHGGAPVGGGSAPTASKGGANGGGGGASRVGGGAAAGGGPELPPSTSGYIAHQTTPNGNVSVQALRAVGAVPKGRSSVSIDRDVETRRQQMLGLLVSRLEVALLDHLDNRAREDGDRARMQVLNKVFKGPMVGARPNDKYVGRGEFLAAFGVLGLPQPPAVLPPTQEKTLKQPVCNSDESLNREVLYAFYDKYSEANGLLDFESLYHRVCQNAVRRKHGEDKSRAKQQQEFVDGLNRSKYQANGRPYTGGERQRSEHLRSTLMR